MRQTAEGEYMKSVAPGPIDFFWMVVYELRQPLTSISGDAQLAKKYVHTNPEKAAEAIDEIVNQVSRIDRLLTILHDRARHESRTHTT